jgi:predicted nucleic acid-binding protein
MTEDADRSTVYVDANPFIYFVEGDEAIARLLRPFFEFLRERPGSAMTSELTLAEVLAKAGSDARRNYFNLILWSNLIQLHPVTRDVLIDTADYRRSSQRKRPDGTIAMVKLPDAIHVVTAGKARCRAFLSSDNGLSLPAGTKLYRVDQAGISDLLRDIS